MQSLTKYSLGDWIYGVVASLIAAVIFALVIFTLRWIWHWMRNFSAEYRRSDQTARIIKIFVYRRYIHRTNVYSLITRPVFRHLSLPPDVHHCGHLRRHGLFH